MISHSLSYGSSAKGTSVSHSLPGVFTLGATDTHAGTDRGHRPTGPPGTDTIETRHYYHTQALVRPAPGRGAQGAHTWHERHGLPTLDCVTMRIVSPLQGLCPLSSALPVVPLLLVLLAIAARLVVLLATVSA